MNGPYALACLFCFWLGWRATTWRRLAAVFSLIAVGVCGWTLVTSLVGMWAS